MPFKIHPMAANAKGGTELMAGRLLETLEDGHADLLEYFDFYFSRLVDFDPDRPSVYFVHDLPDDPEAAHLRNGGWAKFDLIVFVSNWQYQQFKEKFSMDGSNCIVINNGVKPFESDDMFAKYHNTDQVNIIYHTTPHRGLELLYPAFEELSKKYDNINLDVYSSFGVYGWQDRDKPYKALFDQLNAHPKINYHGAVSNDEVREALTKSHIFAYPSIWKETSCLSLIEAMHAANICVHPNLGALIETSGGLTKQYTYTDDLSQHYMRFKGVLQQAIEDVQAQRNLQLVEAAKHRAELLYNWNTIGPRWVDVLQRLKTSLDS